MRHLHLLPVAALALALSLLSGCSEDSGAIDATRLVVDNCGGGGDARVFEPFHLSLAIFGVSRSDGVVVVRAWHHGQPVTSDDGFVLIFNDWDTFQQRAEADPDWAPPLGGEDAVVTGALVLGHTCPDSFAPLEAEGGRVVVTHMGLDPGDHVAITLSDFSLRDTRRDELVGSEFEASMDFTVRGGSPSRPFAE